MASNKEGVLWRVYWSGIEGRREVDMKRVHAGEGRRDRRRNWMGRVRERNGIRDAGAVKEDEE